MVYRHRAQAHWSNGDSAAAQADYDQALALDPTDALAYGSRGLLRYEQGDMTGAMADWAIALQHNPHNATVYYNRGLVYAQTQCLSQALADFDQALDRQPLLAEAYLHRGRVRYDLGDRAGAIQDWQLALCNDLRLDDARQWLLTLQQESDNQALCQQFEAVLPPTVTVQAQLRGDTLLLSLRRPVGTPINYFTLSEALRDRLVTLQLSQIRRFQVMAWAGDSTLAEWNQAYSIYHQLPCPPAHWRAALLSTLLLCPPVGIVALIYAAQVRPAYRRGDYPVAIRISQTVRGLCLSSSAIAALLLGVLMGYGIYSHVEAQSAPAIRPHSHYPERTTYLHRLHRTTELWGFLTQHLPPQRPISPHAKPLSTKMVSLPGP